MSTAKHLQRIRARCVELLEIASKRTPDEWRVWVMSVIAAPRGECDVSKSTRVCSTYRTNEDNRPRTWDATFIASCAGAAEAGWRSTIAAIDGLLKRHAERQSLVETYRQKHSGYNPSCDFATEYASLLEPIIAAWPEELL